MKTSRTPRPKAASNKRLLALMPKISTRTVTVSIPRPRSLAELGAIAKKLATHRVRIGFAIIVVVLCFTEIIPLWQPRINAKSYTLEDTAALLTPATDSLAKRIEFSAKDQTYNYNAGYDPKITGSQNKGGPKITATLNADPTKGVVVTDPDSKITLGMIPQFDLKPAQQQKNRIVYPLADGSGWLVYTMEAGNVKEDILLKHADDKQMSYSYKLDLNSGLEARLLKSGDVGVYGTTMLSGNVSTGSDKDAKLLEKARKNAKKDQLMFVIPAPVIKEKGKTKSDVDSKYELKDGVLTLKVSNLDKGTYPLSIDPSIFVTSAQQFMQGNNETGIDFDTSNNLIQKSKLTGARINTWTNDLALNSARWGAGYAAGGGYGYVVGGNNGSAAQSSVYWAQFDPNNNTIDTPSNPGTGATGCNSSNWCTNTGYNLPNARSGLSSVVYNGYLYAIGGIGADGTCGADACNSVYVSKLGANGEPNTWSATSSLSSARRYAGVSVYKNKLYVLGGQTNGNLNGLDTVEAASVLPNGGLGAWTTTGMTNLPSARWGATAAQYNGYLYLIGGASGTTTQNSVQYARINNNGTVASWVTTASFTNARAAFGGNFATVASGYMYVTSGCATLTTTACSTFTPTTFGSVTVNGSTYNSKGDFQYASINADGSITPFTISAQKIPAPSVASTPLLSATSTAMTGYGLMVWRGALYGIGGCTAVSAVNTCSGVAQTKVQYGTINTDGDISAIFGSSANSDYYNGTSYLSDLPPAGTGTTNAGRMDQSVVINNGYIYNIGGCPSTACTGTANARTFYAPINADGSLGAWVFDAGTGLGAVAAAGATVYNNTIWIVGGTSANTDSAASYFARIGPSGGLIANAGVAWIRTTTAALGTDEAHYPFVFARAVPGSGTQGYLYSVGGCTSTASVGCTAYVALVKRCTISNVPTTAANGVVAGSCTTAGQLQLTTGTGIFAGAVYGNYVYLAGGANGVTTGTNPATGTTCAADVGACGGQTNLVQYAKINAAGNITKADGTSTTGGWNIASGRLNQVRRRTVGFAADGYLYVIAGHDGTASTALPNGKTLEDMESGKIDVATGNVPSFTALATKITPRWDLRAAAANGYVYMLGGCTAGPPPAGCTETNGVGEYAQVYNNWSASPASYTSSTNRPTIDRYGAGATVMNGYIYLAGGCTSVAADCSVSTTATMTNDVTYAQLNADGSIGTWNTAPVLPAALGFGRLENVGGTLYYIGGQTGAAVSQNSVFYSTPDANGLPGAWTNAGNVLPQARSRLNTSVYNGRIYAVGGSSTTTADSTTVYYSPDLTSGGNITSPWTTNATSFSLARSGMSTVAYGNYLYVIGGYDGANYLLDTQYAPINANGSIGAWDYGPSLPQAVRQGDAFATNGFIYAFGGRSAVGTCTNNTYSIAVNADGSLATWSQTSTRFNIPRFGVAAAYDSGRAYLLGGSCGATTQTLTGNDRAVYGTLQIQPQVAQYSLLIDADTNVFPSKYLINGLDNGIGAAWYLSYQSSTTAAASLGMINNTGKLALGTPGTYTPLDASGNNTNTTVGAQYFMLFLTIDDQQAFGYPEDVSRGPNIYDITLQFSSDPGKRLRNGKIFTGGQQQPLDTPF